MLVLLDLDHIKAFIYEARTLRVIRGGSHLLAMFNDWDEVTNRVNSYGGALIYAGGGSVLARFADRGKAFDFIEDMRSWLSDLTCGGASFTHVIEPISGTGFGAAVLRAQRKLQFAKAHRAKETQFAHHFLMRPCQTCGIRPATLRDRFRQQLVCSPCDRRIESGSPGSAVQFRLLETFRLQSGAQWGNAARAEDLETLAAVSGNYIGLIQADGNAMGERLRYLAAQDDDTLFMQFSLECRTAIEKTLLEVLRRAYPHPARYGRQLIFPFEPVIVGGDDITLITSADRAMQVALDFCDGFSQYLDSFAQRSGHQELAVAMSAGVIFANGHYPIALLDELAGQLLKSAKALSRFGDRLARSQTVDFLVLSSSTSRDLKSVRQEQYSRNGQRLTQRPYTAKRLKGLISCLQTMKYPAGDEQAFPRNKLQALYEIPFKTEQQAKLSYQFLRSRLSESHTTMLDTLAEVGCMTLTPPWRSIPRDDYVAQHGTYRDTNLLDAVEIYDFVSKPP